MGKHSRHEPEQDTQQRKKPKGVPSISEEDYYEKANEFRMWLKEAKHKYIDEISSKESRRYFKKFVKKWNENELDDKFYKGMSSAQLGSSDTTRYKWAFAKKLDQFELDSVRDNVDSMTNQSRGDDKMAAGRRRNVGPSMPTNTFDKEEAQERDRSNRKYEAKRSKDRREAMLDEVAPRETGREAALAKKRALNAYHKREKSPDIELSEADLMGGDDFQARLAQERKYQGKRENRLAERREQKLAPILSKMDAYKAKEDATMAMFKKMAEEQKKRGGL
ncbi:hypothetical protein K501DRAFT_206632 [Backusella circina FSU 941]|nr:hypothetical protein K501DRAFT_206632 [Backusella circina FSU 941]